MPRSLYGFSQEICPIKLQRCSLIRTLMAASMWFSLAGMGARYELHGRGYSIKNGMTGRIAL